MDVRTRACRCGAISFMVRGDPERIGICPCHDCRRESGSVFTTFAVWPRTAFECTGEYATHEGRSFCPTCGSRLFALTDVEAEIKLGSLNTAPFNIRPTYELWVKRREPRARPLEGCDQYDEDRL